MNRHICVPFFQWFCQQTESKASKIIADSSKKCVVVLTNDSLVAWNDLVVIGKCILYLRLQ